jgi:hypothetical protein
VTIIRPLALVDEKELARLARLGDLPAHACPCPYGETSKRETAAQIIRLVRQAGGRSVTSNLLRSALSDWDRDLGHDNGRNEGCFHSPEGGITARVLDPTPEGGV